MKSANQRVIENIKKQLKKRKETAEQAAFGAEIAKSSLSRILSGKINPTVRVLEKLANYFEIDISKFFE